MFDKSLITENRLSSALKKDLTPLRLDKETAAAIFGGSGGNLYETSLDSCSCPDFAIQGFAQPCKHMLRLAMEMGEIPSEGMQTDIEAARGKYYLGKGKQYVKEAGYHDFLRFAKNFSELYLFEKSVDDNAFADSLDAASVTDLPWFKFQKSGKVKVEKKWAKDLTNLSNAISERLGTHLMYLLHDENVMAILTEGE